ncbi:MAG: inorganic phosphate transporter, partial [Desulfuromusa sp.]|nr:inorganic phosphate transporter [Desulfuromusa sp.]
WTIIGLGFIAFSVIFQALVMLTRINILKPIVLVGTFALAMAFAANDLVNFIGVPLAGFNSFVLANSGPDPLTTSMAALQKKVPTSTFFLLAAGAIMVVTLWLSRKARTVTKTELSLGRQDEGLERFDSTPLSRIVVRMASTLIDGSSRVFPKSIRHWNRRRMDTKGYLPPLGYDGTVPEFDLLRASVNLMVASAIVSWATSMKLPLSTTYVTFMVAMGSSLADKAWGLESAVYRVTGVLTVIGGWFFTALMAFTTALVFAFAIIYSSGIAVIPLLGLVIFIIIRNIKIHGRREEAARDLDILDLKRVTEADYAVRTCFEHSGRFLSIVRADFSSCFDGILKQDRKQLEQLRRQTKKIQTWSNIIVANIYKAIRLLQQENVKSAGSYITVIAALQEITESLRDMTLRCHVHTSNMHTRLLPIQRKELEQLRQHVESLLDESSAMLLKNEPYDYQKLAAHYIALKETVDEYDHNQIGRITRGVSKTRLSVLFYGISNASRKISKQTLKLLKTFDETFKLEEKTGVQDTENEQTPPENTN